VNTLPSAAALREAAQHQRTAAALAGGTTTGIAKGVYRFASPQAAQAQRIAALADVVAARAAVLAAAATAIDR
jgi:hypothetical protein